SYLGRAPPHVAPVDGEEFARHSHGTKQAASDVKRTKKIEVKKGDVKRADVKKVKRVATRDHSRPVKRPRTVVASKLKAS
ncbi:MAG TPA: peptidase M15, partial [Afipia sp.]|nr:peptidase M15 [Afipia sp.]